jgi:quercetin dioxygenase-like cupin family protein
MAHAGQAIANPVTGERVVFRATAAETGGRLLSMVYHAPAQCRIGPPHIHPRQEERSEVLAGTMRGRVGGADRTVRPGDVAIVAPGVRHMWRSEGDEELHAIVEFRPALGTEAMLEALFALARAGECNQRGMPPALQMAVLMSGHLDEMCAPVIPQAVQTAIVEALAAVGRRRGYGAGHPELRTSSSRP